MIPKITEYMRANGAQFLAKINTDYNGVPATTRFFVDRNGELLAHLHTVRYLIGKDQFVTHSLLNTKNGLSKYTANVTDIIKLNKFKGKKNVKFPYRINSHVIYDDKDCKKSFFFIKDGVTFDRTDKEDGLMIYKKLRNFKTGKISLSENPSD